MQDLPMDKLNGFLIVEKPHGISSNKLLSIIKKRLGIKKIGHAGTLDPMAEGLMMIAINKATKLIKYVNNDDKVYEFDILWNIETDSGDLEGRVIANSNYLPTEKEILAVLPEFSGQIKQIPPIFSALKINGKKSYELARNGSKESVDFAKTKMIEKERIINIYDLSLIKTHNDRAKFLVHCGKGTYVRSLAIDIAKKLNTVGTVCFLRRLKFGQFDEKYLIHIEEISKDNIEELTKKMIMPEKIVEKLNRFDITNEQATELSFGQAICFSEDGLVDIGIEGIENISDTDICLFRNDKLFALAKYCDNKLKPFRLF